MTTTFDPIAYKETTQRQWDAAAEAWHAWGPTLEAWLGESTAAMLDMARVGPGDRVLDVAAGAGQQSLEAARRVGPSGYVLATDISRAILEMAERDARAAGLTHVETLALDGEALEAVEEGSFDAAICRLGLIYMPDPVAALRGVRRALRPGGRVGLIVYSSAERNGFFAIPVGIIRARAGLPAPGPGLPGPFSLGDPSHLEDVLREAGFGQVAIRTLDAPLGMTSAAECVRFERESFGALHQMLSGLSPDEQADTWDEIGRELARFEARDGFTGPCELLVAVGTAGEETSR
jgi:SAM-dependent methyltransferase